MLFNDTKNYEFQDLKMFEHSDYFPTVHCEDCYLKFESQNELEKHKARSHVFSSVFSFLDLSSEDQNFKSRAGGEPLKSDVKIKQKHVHVHKERFYCSVCYRRVNCCRRYRLKLHIQQKHPEAEVLTIGCSKCDKKIQHVTCDKHGSFEIFCDSKDKILEESKPSPIAPDTLRPENESKLYLEKSSREKSPPKKIQLQCDLCPYKAGWAKRLESHMKNVHENVKQFFCSLCHHATFFKANLEKHIKIHKNDAAKVCKIGCSLCDSLKDHNTCNSLGKIQKTKEKKPFQCEECHFSSDSEASLNRHIDNIHKKYLRFSCKICDFKSFYNHHVKEHVTRVHGIEKDVKKLVEKICDGQKEFSEDSIPYPIVAKKQRPKKESKEQTEKKAFSCEECGVSTKSAENLKVHIDAIHNGVVRFTCSVCDFKSYSKFNVEKHQSRRHEKEDNDSVYVITLNQGMRERADPHVHFSCNLCEKKSYTAFRMREHQLKKHRNEKVEILKLACGKCGPREKKIIKNENKFYQTDDESSLKRNSCFVCNKACSSHRERVSHYRREHPADRIFNCNLCDYGSNFLGNFKIHERNHEKGFGFRGRKRYKARILREEIKLFPCFVCNLECDSQRQRVLHYSLEHPEEKIFKCGDCQYGTNSPGNFEKHQSTHEIQVKLKTKHKCLICNIEFKGIGEKTIHYVEEHPSERIYNCHLCGYGSNNRSNVTYHLEHIHGVPDDLKQNVRAKPKMKSKDIKCKDCDKLFPTYRQLTIHYRADHPDKRIFKCESCEYSSNYLPNIKTHNNSTHKRLELSCSFCVFITTWNTTFHQHMRDKHGVFQKFRTRVGAHLTGSLICEECGYKAKTEKQMRNHAHLLTD